MKEFDCSKKSSGAKKAAFGIMLFAAGVLLLGFNMGYLPPEHHHIVFSFPTLILAIGVINLFDRKSLFFGLVMTLIGAGTLIPKILDVHYDFSTIFWPLVLMGIGLLILTKKFMHNPIKDFKKRRKEEFKDCDWMNDGDFAAGKGAKMGYIDQTNIFSGNEMRFIEPQFRGGTITNIFGGTEIDFTRSQLAEGKNYLDITCVFGGANIVVPSDWKVTIQVNAILGAFEDKRFFIDYDADKQFDRELIITGTVIFGGGELKSR